MFNYKTKKRYEEKVLETRRKNKWGIKKHSFDDVLTEWDITEQAGRQRMAGSAEAWKQEETAGLSQGTYQSAFYLDCTCLDPSWSRPPPPLPFYW